VSCRRIQPPEFGAVVDRANSAAQNKLAALVPGAVHITHTHSGHNIMIDNAPIVIQAIRDPDNVKGCWHGRLPFQTQPIVVVGRMLC
jgi:hypothetical protein